MSRYFVNKYYSPLQLNKYMFTILFGYGCVTVGGTLLHGQPY